MSPVTIPAPLVPERFPRVSGDEPSLDIRQIVDGLFSPRERG